MTMVAIETGRRERKREETRAHLLATAIRMMEEQGFEAVTVEAIAEAADVGKGTIYNYFGTKEEIIVAFFVEIERKVQAKAARRQPRQASLEAVLTAFLRYQLRLKEPYYRFVRIFFTQMFARSEQMLPYVVELQAIIDPPIVQLFTQLQERGLLRRDVAMPMLVHQFKTMHFGISASWALEGPPWRGVARVLPQQVQLLCSGFGTAKGGR
jgi:AcrR family transcriptional regulator